MVTELALDFIERYGALAFLSGELIRHRMLAMNRRWLEEFLRSPKINPHLKAKHALSADLFAEHGSGKQHARNMVQIRTLS